MSFYAINVGIGPGMRTIAVTADQVTAEAVKKKYEGGPELVQIEPMMDAETLLRPCWFVRFNKDGSVKDVRNCSDDVHSYRVVDQRVLHHTDESFFTGSVCVRVIADDPEAAIKIAAPLRAQYLSE